MTSLKEQMQGRVDRAMCTMYYNETEAAQLERHSEEWTKKFFMFKEQQGVLRGICSAAEMLGIELKADYIAYYQEKKELEV